MDPENLSSIELVPSDHDASEFNSAVTAELAALFDEPRQPSATGPLGQHHLPGSPGSPSPPVPPGPPRPHSEVDTDDLRYSLSECGQGDDDAAHGGPVNSQLPPRQHAQGAPWSPFPADGIGVVDGRTARISFQEALHVRSLAWTDGSSVTDHTAALFGPPSIVVSPKHSVQSPAMRRMIQEPFDPVAPWTTLSARVGRLAIAARHGDGNLILMSPIMHDLDQISRNGAESQGGEE